MKIYQMKSCKFTGSLSFIERKLLKDLFHKWQVKLVLYTFMKINLSGLKNTVKNYSVFT